MELWGSWESLDSDEIHCSSGANECSEARCGPKGKQSSLKWLPKSLTSKTYSYAHFQPRLHSEAEVPRCKRPQF